MTPTATGTFAGQGGVPIRWTRWEPSGAPRGVMLVSHGYAEHAGRYAHVAAHWTKRGLAVAAVDHRGHGRSGGPRGHCRDFGELTADLRTLADQAEAWWPGVPRLLFGHSMGGLVGLLYLLEHGETVRAAALSGLALRVPDAAPRGLLRVARALGRVAPRVRFRTALAAEHLARDPEVGRAYLADPLVHRVATAGFVRAIAAAQARALAGAHRVRRPLLVLQGEADRLVDPAGAVALQARLVAPDQTVELLPRYYHELLNEPPAERDRVLARLDAWAERHLGPAA